MVKINSVKEIIIFMFKNAVYLRCRKCTFELDNPFDIQKKI